MSTVDSKRPDISAAVDFGGGKSHSQCRFCAIRTCARGSAGQCPKRASEVNPIRSVVGVPPISDQMAALFFFSRSVSLSTSPDNAGVPAESTLFDFARVFIKFKSVSPIFRRHRTVLPVGFVRK